MCAPARTHLHTYTHISVLFAVCTQSTDFTCLYPAIPTLCPICVFVGTAITHLGICYLFKQGCLVHTDSQVRPPRALHLTQHLILHQQHNHTHAHWRGLARRLWGIPGDATALWACAPARDPAARATFTAALICRLPRAVAASGRTRLYAAGCTDDEAYIGSGNEREGARITDLQVPVVGSHVVRVVAHVQGHNLAAHHPYKAAAF